MAMAGVNVSERLKSFVERIEALVRDKKAISDDIKEVFAEAREAEFDVKIIRDVIKRRALSEEQRDEYDGMMQLYQMSLGMLADTGLGAAALRKLNANQLAEDRTTPEGQADLEDAIDESKGKKKKKKPGAREVPGIGIVSDLDIKNAREEGRKAAKAGETLPECNKYLPHDPRRAEFDAGYCSAIKSTGMAIPDAFRRKADVEKERKRKAAEESAKPPKKEKPKADTKKASTKRATKERAEATNGEQKPKAAKPKKSTKKGGSPWKKTGDEAPAESQPPQPSASEDEGQRPE